MDKYWATYKNRQHSNKFQFNITSNIWKYNWIHLLGNEKTVAIANIIENYSNSDIKSGMSHCHIYSVFFWLLSDKESQKNTESQKNSEYMWPEDQPKEMLW